MSDKEQPPKPDKRDVAYKLGKIVAAAAGGVASSVTTIPGLSALATEIYSSILRPPLTKRTNEFLTELAEKLQVLEVKIKGFSIDSLQHNELFISIIWQATQKAMGNHHREKLEALQNAVLNCAKSINIDENIQMILLRYIDDFTPLHLKMLALLDNPRQYLQTVNRPLADNLTAISLQGFIQHAILEFHKRHEDIRIIYGDLYNHGLLNTSPESINQSIGIINAQIYNPRTTDMARTLLRYITAPRELELPK